MIFLTMRKDITASEKIKQETQNLRYNFLNGCFEMFPLLHNLGVKNGLRI